MPPRREYEFWYDYGATPQKSVPCDLCSTSLPLPKMQDHMISAHLIVHDGVPHCPYARAPWHCRSTPPAHADMALGLCALRLDVACHLGVVRWACRHREPRADGADDVRRRCDFVTRDLDEIVWHLDAHEVRDASGEDTERGEPEGRAMQDTVQRAGATDCGSDIQIVERCTPRTDPTPALPPILRVADEGCAQNARPLLALGDPQVGSEGGAFAIDGRLQGLAALHSPALARTPMRRDAFTEYASQDAFHFDAVGGPLSSAAYEPPVQLGATGLSLHSVVERLRCASLQAQSSGIRKTARTSQGEA
ncbi:hypothetical protein PsYK624_067080 [Phanerochaete sordida]|uniref:Uncharacterized protein n=1 Tax=Phanerochaete sordida TaxID=48140 RepID=A0A9P3LCU1_9APHY|nr:hypothetical protein PsYK624_067080 [Phanerochaete sordida]